MAAFSSNWWIILISSSVAQVLADGMIEFLTLTSFSFFVQSCSHPESQFPKRYQHSAYTVEVTNQTRSCTCENHLCWC